MTTRHCRGLAAISGGLWLLLTVTLCLKTWRVWQQQKQDRALIAALSNGVYNANAALNALQHGANANACITDRPAASLWQCFRLSSLIPSKASSVLEGRTAIDFAVNPVGTEKANVQLVRSLLEQGTNPNVVNSYSNTPLWDAITSEDTAIIQALLDAGANIEARNKWEDTPLFAAANNSAIMRLLLARHANAHVSNFHGVTPLMVAAGYRNAEVMKLLLEAGADVRAKDKSGFTAYDRACDTAHYGADSLKIRCVLEVLSYVCAQSDSEKKFLRATRHNDARTVDAMLNANMNPDLCDSAHFDQTALVVAVETGYLDEGSDYPVSSPRNVLGVVRALLLHGADVTRTCPDGCTTALSVARRHGSKELIRLLERAKVQWQRDHSS